VSQNPELERLLALVVTGDPKAAAEVRTLADRLYALAERLEAEARPEVPFVAPSGITDRVRMSVRGPDGSIKIETDTAAPSPE
jgi:hypothetical protein